MNWSPLFNSDFAIVSHALLAIASIVLGALQFVLPKGTRLHKLIGYVWASMMLYVAASSFFIHEIKLIADLFSPIHLLSIYVLFSVTTAVWKARKGDIKGHRQHMIQLYIFALIITGGFTFFPGRIMHQVLFG